MSNFKPSLPYDTPAMIMKGVFTKINGINVKSFTEGDLIYVSAKSYGGTEKVINDKYGIIDTMQFETWFRPDIKSEDAIKLLDDNTVWEIMNTPEDIDRNHLHLKFKGQRYKGKA